MVVILVVITKKNDELKICIDFTKLNTAIKKAMALPFTYEVLNILTRYEAYSFLDGYLGYRQIFTFLEYIYKTTFVTKGFLYGR
jgi:hypothetical protein